MHIEDLPPYRYQVFRDKPPGEYIAECAEIPGLSGIGDTPEEALREIKEAVAGWLEVLEEDGMSSPPPEGEQGPAYVGWDWVFGATEEVSTFWMSPWPKHAVVSAHVNASAYLLLVVPHAAAPEPYRPEPAAHDSNTSRVLMFG